MYRYIGEKLEHEVTLKDGRLYIVVSDYNNNYYSFWFVSCASQRIRMSKTAGSVDDIMKLNDNKNYHLGIKLKNAWQTLSVVML